MSSLFPTCLVVCASLWTVNEADADRPFTIVVVDDATGRGVPLVELTTVDHSRYYTDSAGVVAFAEPGWMNQTVYFGVRSHGYEFPPDGFGFRGRKLEVKPGGQAELRLRRVNVAERLYRITGSGIYTESRRAGRKTPLEVAALNGLVTGSDSVQAALFQQRIYWFWGDTNRPEYPLGNFHAPGATSPLPGRNGTDPEVGVSLDYFLGPDQFAKPTCRMPGEGPTWIDGLAVVTDNEGEERLFAHYLKVKPPLSVYEEGVAEFVTAKREFERRLVFPNDAKVLPSGHSFRLKTPSREDIYFAKPFPVIRVPATAESILDPTRYETYSCVVEDQNGRSVVERDHLGRAQYRWRNRSVRFTTELQESLVAAGKLSERESLFRVRDSATGRRVKIHHGSMNWNEHRRRWVVVASESGGSSMLGEVWYAEADTPLGPWAYATKIVTHDRQSFYNPRQHPFFDQDGGRRIFFEGTYTNSFSGNPEQTPRYEYNQIMYRLDLDDPRLVQPRAVYRLTVEDREIVTTGALVPRNEEGALGMGELDGSFRQVAFCAPDRAFPGSVPVYTIDSATGTRLTLAAPAASAPPCFFAWPTRSPVADEPTRSASVALYEWTRPDGGYRYAVAGESIEGAKRGDDPVAFVWPW